MIKFIAFRLVQTALILLVLSFVIYMLLDFMPGDPIEDMLMAKSGMKTEDVQRLKEQMGLDKSAPVRYKIWLHDVLVKRDLGYSSVYKRPTADILFNMLRNTMKLTSLSFFISLLIAIPLGIFSSLRQYTKVDYLINFFAFVGISIPTFWFGLLMIYVFSQKLGWLPSSGLMDPSDGGFVDQLRHLIMPAFVLGLASTGGWVRYTRASMLEVIRSDYVRTARAKGLDEESVVIKHAFRNALIPIVTIMALSIPFIFSGAVITEKVFGFPGMGNLIFNSIISKDYYVAMVALLSLSGLTIICNMLADLAYAWVDPRIRVG